MQRPADSAYRSGDYTTLFRSCRETIREQPTGARLTIPQGSSAQQVQDMIEQGILTASDAPHLKALHLCGSRNDKDVLTVALNAIGVRRSQIKSLVLEDWALGNAAYCLAALRTGWAALEQLTVRGVPGATLHVHAIQDIAGLQRLTSLVIDCSVLDAPDDKVLQPLSCLAALTRFQFEGNVRAPVEGAKALGRAITVDYNSVLAHLTSLTTLSIRSPTLSGFEGLVGAANHLRELNITFPQRYMMGDDDWSAISSCTGLTHLSLDQPRWTPAQAHPIDDLLRPPEKMSARYLCSTLQSLTSLRTLALTSNTELGDDDEDSDAAAPAPAPAPTCHFTELRCGLGLATPTLARVPLSSVQHIVTADGSYQLLPPFQGGNNVVVIQHGYQMFKRIEHYKVGELKRAVENLASSPALRQLSKVIVAVCEPWMEGYEPCPGYLTDKKLAEYEYEEKDVEDALEECLGVLRPLCQLPHLRVVLNTRVLNSSGEYARDENGELLRDGDVQDYVTWM